MVLIREVASRWSIPIWKKVLEQFGLGVGIEL